MKRDDWDPRLYAEKAGYVADLGREILGWLAPRADERVLDLGCGEGALTRLLVDAGCDVVAVDSSPAQVEAARRRGIDARVADGQALEFEGEFDAVFSNAALHWMREPERVARGVYRALRPGGRFVGEFGGEGNVRTVCSALRLALDRRGRDFDRLQPWYFPSVEVYRDVLASVGFSVDRIELFPRPTPIPGDVAEWLEVFGSALFSELGSRERDEVISEVRDATRAQLCDRAGTWHIDYVRLRFAARRAP